MGRQTQRLRRKLQQVPETRTLQPLRTSWTHYHRSPAVQPIHATWTHHPWTPDQVQPIPEEDHPWTHHRHVRPPHHPWTHHPWTHHRHVRTSHPQPPPAPPLSETGGCISKV